ncbi:unnamed protein product [Calypogeia fissa]
MRGGKANNGRWRSGGVVEVRGHVGERALIDLLYFDGDSELRKRPVGHVKLSSSIQKTKLGAHGDHLRSSAATESGGLAVTISESGCDNPTLKPLTTFDVQGVLQEV